MIKSNGSKKKNIAVFISGNGSNLEKLIKSLSDKLSMLWPCLINPLFILIPVLYCSLPKYLKLKFVTWIIFSLDFLLIFIPSKNLLNKIFSLTWSILFDTYSCERKKDL